MPSKKRPRLNPKTQRQSAEQDKNATAVAEMWFNGMTQREIGEKLGLSVKQVYDSLRHSRDLWRENRIEDLDMIIATELARIDRVESEAWAGWERSQKVTVETVDESKDTPYGPMSLSRTKKIQRYGEAMFLKVVLECVSERCRVTGIYETARDNAKRRAGEEANENLPMGVLVVVDTHEQANRILEYDEWESAVAASAD